MTAVTLPIPKRRNQILIAAVLSIPAYYIYKYITYVPPSKPVRTFEEQALISLNDPSHKAGGPESNTGTGGPETGGDAHGVLTDSTNINTTPEKGNGKDKKQCTISEEMAYFEKLLKEDVEKFKNNKKKIKKNITKASLGCMPKVGKKIIKKCEKTNMNTGACLLALNYLVKWVCGENDKCLFTSDGPIVGDKNLEGKKVIAPENKQNDKELKAKNTCLAFVDSFSILKDISFYPKEQINDSFTFEWRKNDKVIATCFVKNEHISYLSTNS